ncbi:hypothetical protein FRB93_006217 [Tulasnella sp. JGI-2019a]|nr:hypothetical protein FRB93_006217 [Tulasnella sp. JGI-2019a]
MTRINDLLTTSLICVLLYGAFSRLTHGVYTPTFHAFQIDRAPGGGNTQANFIPFVDIAAALLTTFPKSRTVGATFVTVVSTLGLAMRLRKGKEWSSDVALLGLALATMISSFKARTQKAGPGV